MKTTIQPHQQRVIDEKKSLDENRDKLDLFCAGPIFKTLPQIEQDMLFTQLDMMDGYSLILRKKIALFGVAA